jgi:sodium transport system permease protein
LVLGLLAVRSGSLLPCMLFHFTYNALEVFRGRFGAELGEGTGLFVDVTEQGIRYRWPTLVIAAVVAALLLRWLILHSGRPAADRTTPSTERQPSFAPGEVAKQPPVGVS